MDPRNLRPRRLVSLVLAVVGAVLLPRAPLHAADSSAPMAEPTVGPLANVRAWAITGCTRLAASDIRASLAWDEDLAKALDPAAPLAVLLARAQERVLSGYRHNGFPQATVSAAVVGHAMAITVVEGPQLRCGTVRIIGATDPAAVERWLTNPIWRDDPAAPERTHIQYLFGEPDPTNQAQFRDPQADADERWLLGKPAPCDAVTIDGFAESVRSFYVHLGRYDAAVRAAVSPAADGLATLTVTIASEGHLLTVGAVRVTGVPPTTADLVRATLAIAANTPATPDLVASARAALRASGRFTSVQAALTGDGPATRDLEITLAPLRAHIAPLGAALTHDEQLVLRCARTLEAWGRGSDARVLAVDAPFPIVSLGAMSVRLSPSERAFALLVDRDDPGRCFGMSIRDGTLALLAPHARWSHKLGGTYAFILHTSLTVPTEFDEDAAQPSNSSSFNFQLTVQQQQRSGLVLDFRVEPSAAIAFLHGRKTWRAADRGRDLVRVSDYGTFTIHDEAEPMPSIAPSGAQGTALALLPPRSELVPAPAAADRVGEDDYDLLLGTITPCWLARAGSPRAAALCADLGQALHPYFMQVIGPAVSHLNDPGRFDMPRLPGEDSNAPDLQPAMVRLVAYVVASLFPQDSWSAGACIELTQAATRGDLRVTLERMADDDSVGPLRCLLLMRVAWLLNEPAAAIHIADAGKGRMQAAALGADADALCPRGDLLRSSLARLHDPATAIDVLLGHEDARLQHALTTQPDERLADLLRIAWEDGLRDRIRAAFDAAAGDSGSF